ncbi:hypothetical protein NMG60_11026951 [Bertholletia excelsa]
MAAPSCQIVVQELMPCLSYLSGTMAYPTAICCNGVSDLARFSEVKKDRSDVCECIKSVGSTFGRMVNLFLIPALPGRCGLQIKLPPVSYNTNCSTSVPSYLSLFLFIQQPPPPPPKFHLMVCVLNAGFNESSW